MGRILCASDLSEGADEAIRQACALAGAEESVLELLHVVANPAAKHPALGHLPRRHEVRAARAAARKEAREQLAKRVASLAVAPPPQTRIEVVEGVPEAEIVERAGRMGAGLIVVGGKSATFGPGSPHVGEVAERVVRHARGPVLVARRGPRSGKILAVTDLSGPPFPAITTATEEARRRGGALTVLYNVEPALRTIGQEVVSSLVLLFSNDLTAEHRRRGAEARLAGTLERLGVKGDTVVTRGATAAAVLRLAGELPAELVVVVGSSGSTLPGRVLFGSVIEAIVRFASCSVLVVRRGGEAAAGTRFRARPSRAA